MSYLANSPHPVRQGNLGSTFQMTTEEHFQSQTSPVLKRDTWSDQVLSYNGATHGINKLYGNRRHYAVDRPFIQKGLNNTSGYVYNYTIKAGNVSTDPRFDGYNPVDLGDNFSPLTPYRGMDFRPSTAMDIGTSLGCGYRTEYYEAAYNPVPPSNATYALNRSTMTVLMLTEAT
jgi:hypothetical protein